MHHLLSCAVMPNAVSHNCLPEQIEWTEEALVEHYFLYVGLAILMLDSIVWVLWEINTYKVTNTMFVINDVKV